jgi:hypothetical protein
VISTATIAGLRLLGGWLAEPLAASDGAVPTWNVEVASTSVTSSLALAYSRESGIHVLRIPGANGAQANRVIPAKISAGELHLVSLGIGRLDVRGRGPRGSKLRTYEATARTVTVFDRADGAGVRTGW